MNLLRKLAVVIVAFGSVSVVQATPITYEFSGSFDRLLTFDSDITPDVSLSELFAGTFSYNDETSLARIIDPDTRALYRTGSILLESGAHSYSASSGGQLQIFNNWEFSPGGPAIDDFFLSVRQSDTEGLGFYLLQLNMRDYSLSTLSDLSIPTTSQVEDLAWNGRFFLRRFESVGNESWEADGRFRGITMVSVPEPGTLGLLGIGLLGLALLRRKRLSSLSSATPGD